MSILGGRMKRKIKIAVILLCCNMYSRANDTVIIIPNCPPLLHSGKVISNKDQLKKQYSLLIKEVGNSLNGIALDLKQVDRVKYKSVSKELLLFMHNLIYCDSIWIEKKVRLVNIIALNGSADAFNYTKKIIQRNEGCLRYAAIASLSLFNKRLVIDYLLEMFCTSNDAREKILILRALCHFKEFSAMKCFEKELDKEDREFYWNQYDCEYFFDSPTPVSSKESMKEILWELVEELAGARFHRDKKKLNSWIDSNLDAK